MLPVQVLELYKAPLRVQGWCESLIQTARVRAEDAQGDLPAYCAAAQQLPSLLLTGAHDRLAPGDKALEALSSDLGGSCMAVLPGCGHLSHEEAPGALLAALVPFCGRVIDEQQQHHHQQQQQQGKSQCERQGSGSLGPSVAGQGLAAGVPRPLAAVSLSRAGSGVAQQQQQLLMFGAHQPLTVEGGDP